MPDHLQNEHCSWTRASVGRAKEELVKAGMEREFVGRLPVRVALQALSDEDLFQVLTQLSCSQSFIHVC